MASGRSTSTGGWYIGGGGGGSSRHNFEGQFDSDLSSWFSSSTGDSDRCYVERVVLRRDEAQDCIRLPETRRNPQGVQNGWRSMFIQCFEFLKPVFCVE
ncbi:hypothetical protein Acr_04g0003000 [Actinidia rufa]|uniref:Uncharacterized protein n=1 Tax=Actinidia rufa TaxID=165716 RepID=A0A7J0EH22_9ERIC|nr:hypothetical protein Acr_04g0003000 [Actinidia rufa]